MHPLDSELLWRSNPTGDFSAKKGQEQGTARVKLLSETQLTPRSARILVAPPHGGRATVAVGV